MKFSERFFKFPIKVYDSASVKRVMKMERELDDPGEAGNPAWARGYACFPYWDLNDLYYYDGYTAGTDTRIVNEKGFELTMVYHKDFGDFECLWKRDRFEKELDLFTEKYEKYYDDLLARKQEEESVI